MGLFDFLKKKEPEPSLPSSIETTAVVSQKQPTLRLHEDLRGLVWIADGIFKNYLPKPSSKQVFEAGGISFTISLMGQEEPSLIHTKERITIPPAGMIVDRPPYYPTYYGLTPEQKWVYLNLLENPYNKEIDIGFVFVLYYGLERHLLEGDFDSAFRVILKLRDVHHNKSFQSYSANALVLTSMAKGRGDMAMEFINSLDKEHELAFSDNLFLICYFSFDIPLKPKDIMRMAKTFEFTKANYIKNYPTLFEECLRAELMAKTGKDNLDIKQFVTKSDLKRMKTKEVSIFANTSITEKSFEIPLLSEVFKLKKTIYDLLDESHEAVKAELAVKRKSGEQPKKEVAKESTRPLLMFDQLQEASLLKELEQNRRNPIARHFTYIQLQDFYYRYRDLDQAYLQKGIEYCWLDIKSLQELQSAHIEQELATIRILAPHHDSEYNERDIKRVQEAGFRGTIPAFSRLAIIFEKAKDFEKAIEVCDQAIAYGHGHDSMSERKLRILDKFEKSK